MAFKPVQQPVDDFSLPFVDADMAEALPDSCLSQDNRQRLLRADE